MASLVNILAFAEHKLAVEHRAGLPKTGRVSRANGTGEVLSPHSFLLASMMQGTQERAHTHPIWV